MKTVLITGVTGFIERYVARQFSESGWTVAGLGTRPLENAPRQNLSHYQQLVLPSVELAVMLQQLQPSICIHCAGRSSVDLSMEDPSSDFNASLAITFNLLDAIRIHCPECKVIFLSSAAVYGNPKNLPIHENHNPDPISSYGFHKLMCEQLCVEFHKLYGLATLIVRIFSAYGPGLRCQVLWDMCQRALTQSSLSLKGTGNESRDFIHARDVANALFLLTEKASFEANIYNLANGVETTIGELARLVLTELNLSIPIRFDGVVPVGNPLNWRADIGCLKEIGFTPEVPLDRGVRIFSQWCQAEIIGW